MDVNDINPQPNEAAVNRTIARKRLNEGWYGFRVTGAMKKVNEKSGNLRLSITCCPLTDVNDEESIQSRLPVFHQLTLPLVNPAMAGHTEPNTWGFVTQFARATGLADIPRVPYYEGDELIFNGVVIDPSEKDAKRLERSKIIESFALEIWDDPSVVEDATFFGLVVHENEYPRFARLSAELPEDAELTPPDEFEDTVIPGRVSNGNA